MKIVLIGNGGREHALAWKLSQSPLVEEIIAIPGSAGMQEVAESLPVIWTSAQELAEIIVTQSPDLVVVGPEAPLAAGIADELEWRNIPVFGPTKAAARIESSKAFAKELFAKYHIPTADFQTFTDLKKAIAYLKKLSAPYVIKADGLAAGKGVVIAETEEEAVKALRRMLESKGFGKAGSQVVIEEYLVGEEASLLAFVDGETIVPMIAAQDHKRIYDHDRGPNTGGMGAFAPAPVLKPEWYEMAVEQILRPTAKALVAEGSPFRGILYAGLMLTEGGPKVIEFNCRFGDPETQVLLPLLETDFAEVMLATVEGRLAEVTLQWKPASAICVVAASFGYPEHAYTGDSISGLEKAAEKALVFHAGTRCADGVFSTAGGRVLNIVAVQPTLAEAKEVAYQAMKEIQFDGMQYRMDIADKELLRNN